MPTITELNQFFTLGVSIMLPMDMVRIVVSLILGKDSQWLFSDITAEPVQTGRSKPELIQAGYEYTSRDAEITRTVRITGQFVRDGTFIRFSSCCKVHNYRNRWEPWWAEVKVGHNPVRSFYWVRKDGQEPQIEEQVLEEAKKS